jgi:hypothetical protein
MSTGWDRLSAEALRHEVEHCRDLLARHVELFDNLVECPERAQRVEGQPSQGE